MLVAVLAGLLRLARLLEDHIAVEVVGGLVDGRVRAHSQSDGCTAKAVVCLVLNAMLPSGSPSAPTDLLETNAAMTTYLVWEGGRCIQEIMDTIG